MRFIVMSGVLFLNGVFLAHSAFADVARQQYIFDDQPRKEARRLFDTLRSLDPDSLEVTKK